MQIALDQFRSNILRIRHLDGVFSALSAQTGGALDLSDMLRTEVVFAVSALDHYVHEATRLGMIEVIMGRRAQTAAFKKFQVPLEHVVRGISNPGSGGWLDDAVRQAHGWRAFQLPDKIAEAVRLISSIALWDQLAQVRGVTAQDLKLELSAIVDRRNKIVHESDLDPSFPGTLWSINQADARAATDLVEWIGETMHPLIA